MVDEYLCSDRGEFTELENYMDHVSNLVFGTDADFTLLPDIVEKGMSRYEVAQAYLRKVLSI